MLKVFNTLETLENENFLKFVSKKHDLQDEDELEDNVDALIKVVIKKWNNLPKLGKGTAKAKLKEKKD